MIHYGGYHAGGPAAYEDSEHRDEEYNCTVLPSGETLC